MFVIINLITNEYYSDNGWVSEYKLAKHLTQLRADEIFESLKLKVDKGWERGNYLIQPIV